MLEFSKQWGPYFFTGFIALVLGIVQVFIFLKDSPCLLRNLVIILSILAIICFILTIMALFYHLMDIYRRKREKKRDDSHKALKESFKVSYKASGKSDEEAEKLAELAATGDTQPYQSVNGLEDDGWISIRDGLKKSCRKKK